MDHDGRPTGSYTDIVRHIAAYRSRDVTRQQVYMWWSRRTSNGFPLGWEHITGRGTVRRFFLDQVLKWHDATYRYDDDKQYWRRRPRTRKSTAA